MESNLCCWSCIASSFQLCCLKFCKPPTSLPQLSNNISTLDGHFRHTMDNPAYLRSISIGNGNVNSGNVTNSNNIVNVNKVIADENPEIMQWLSPLDPRRRHQGVRTDRLDGVGNWILEKNEFGSGEAMKVEWIRLSYFAAGIPEWGRHI